MNSTTFFNIFILIIAGLLLSVNFILAPHNPYTQKNGPFECGYSSFIGQSRIQFSISFFIFALLFLLFDLEVLLVYPYFVCSYVVDINGLGVMLIFLLVLIIGFGFELGKQALSIESRQTEKSADIDEQVNIQAVTFFVPKSLEAQKASLLSTGLFETNKSSVNKPRFFSTAKPSFIDLPPIRIPSEEPAHDSDCSSIDPDAKYHPEIDEAKNIQEARKLHDEAQEKLTEFRNKLQAARDENERTDSQDSSHNAYVYDRSVDALRLNIAKGRDHWGEDELDNLPNTDTGTQAQVGTGTGTGTVTETITETERVTEVETETVTGSGPRTSNSTKMSIDSIMNPTNDNKSSNFVDNRNLYTEFSDYTFEGYFTEISLYTPEGDCTFITFLPPIIKFGLIIYRFAKMYNLYKYFCCILSNTLSLYPFLAKKVNISTVKCSRTIKSFIKSKYRLHFTRLMRNTPNKNDQLSETPKQGRQKG